MTHNLRGLALRIMTESIVVALLVLSGVAGAGTWSVQTSGTTADLQAVDFIDINNGWAVGGGGTILHTTNGGLTWTPQNSGVTNTLTDVDFVDLNHGWVVAYNSKILHTLDGGNTWTTQYSWPITNAEFIDANNGWAVGYDGTIRRTTNGGRSWTLQTSGTTNPLYALEFTDANNGWAVGRNGTILHTTNGGTTWTLQTSGVTNYLTGMDFVDINNGWVVGDPTIILHTTNGGTTWTIQTTGTSNPLEGVKFVDANNGWVTGDNGLVLHTTNGGTTWTIQTSGTTNYLVDVDFVNASNGWAVGLGGTILRYSEPFSPLLTINVSPSNASVIVGSTQTFTAVTRDQSGNPITVAVTWSSSNTTVGTINPNSGLFTALAAGTTTITATVGTINGTATMTVRIISGVITGTVTNATSGAAIVGATVTAGGMTATTNGAGAYTISNAPGTYTVTASAAGFVTSTVNVTVTSGATVIQNFALQRITATTPTAGGMISRAQVIAVIMAYFTGEKINTSDPVMLAYDTNSDGNIQRSEAVRAEVDYFTGPPAGTSSGTVTRSFSSSFFATVLQGGTIVVTLTPWPVTLFDLPGYQIVETIPAMFTVTANTAAGATNVGNVWTFTQIGYGPISYTVAASSTADPWHPYIFAGTFRDDNNNQGSVSGVFYLLPPDRFVSPDLTIVSKNIRTNTGEKKNFNLTLWNIGDVDLNISEVRANASWINTISAPFIIKQNETKDVWFLLNASDVTPGNYTINLTIQGIPLYGLPDKSGKFQKYINISVYQATASASIANVRVVDNKTGSLIPNAALMVENSSSIYYTSNNGIAQIETKPGTKAIYAYASNYRPTKKFVKFETWDNDIEVRLDRGDIVSVNVSSRRLNLTEIRNAGINLTDPGNFWVYNFTVNLTVKLADLTEYEVWFEKTIITPNGTMPGGPGGATLPPFEYSRNGTDYIIHPFCLTCGRYSEGGRTSEAPQAYGFIIILGQIRLLKEFFEVSAIISNNADTIFALNNIIASLTLPEGLTLVPLFGIPQSNSKSLGNIAGGSQNSTKWIVRGDMAGNHTVNVNITGTLMPFNLSINASGSGNVRVYGKPYIEVTFMPSRYVRKGLPFTFAVGIKNPTPIPLYLVTVELFNKEFKNVTLADGEKPEKQIETINPGEKKYVFWQMVPNLSGFVVLEASRVTSDPNLRPALSFLDDSPEGMVTAYMIASKEVINSEVQAFAGTCTQWILTHRTTSEDMKWRIIGTIVDIGSAANSMLTLMQFSEMGSKIISFAEISQQTGDKLQEGIKLFEEIFNGAGINNATYLTTCNSSYYLSSEENEAEIIEKVLRNVSLSTVHTNGTLLQKDNSWYYYTPVQIHSLFFNDTNNTINYLRLYNLSDSTIKKIRGPLYKSIENMQVASRSPTVLYVPNDSKIYPIGGYTKTYWSQVN